MLSARCTPSVPRIVRRTLVIPPSVTLRNVFPLAPQFTGFTKRHASFPGGQFPGIRIPGQQPPEKGATLKQYVSEQHL